MLLYTLQTHEAFGRAIKEGKFSGDLRKIKKHWGKDWKMSFGPAYQFMMDQMAKRLPHFSGDYPMWAWNNKPDLRCSEWKWDGGPWVLFSIEVPESRVLLSDFSLYHSLLMDSYISLTSDEDETVDRNGYNRKEKEKSWERIFDLNLPSNKKQERWLGRKKDRELQACVDNIYIDEIVDVIKWRV